jgi:hypothetical protein
LAAGTAAVPAARHDLGTSRVETDGAAAGSTAGGLAINITEC